MSLDKIFRSVSPGIAMLIDEFFRKMFSEVSMTFEYMLYETVMLSVELSILRKLDKKTGNLYARKLKIYCNIF